MRAFPRLASLALDPRPRPPPIWHRFCFAWECGMVMPLQHAKPMTRPVHIQPVSRNARSRQCPIPIRGIIWREAMTTYRSCCILVLAGSLLMLSPARGEQVLRIAMTASDIPTTTGMPNNGFEGMRFLGYPIFEGLVSWDLTRADRLATLRSGLAERWEQAADDKKTWIFHLTARTSMPMRSSGISTAISRTTARSSRSPPRR